MPFQHQRFISFPYSDDAVKLHDAIMKGEDAALKQALKHSIQLSSNFDTWRSYDVKHSNDGTPSVYVYAGDEEPLAEFTLKLTDNGPLDMSLRQAFGTDYRSYLEQHHFLRSNAGFWDSITGNKKALQEKFTIDLREVANSLPKSMLPLPEFDPVARAKELGCDYENFKQALRKAFKGTYGIPGQPDFTIFIDDTIRKAPPYRKYLELLGEKADPDFFNASSALHRSDKDKVLQYMKDRGIDDKSVIIIAPERNFLKEPLSPLLMQNLAQILNFQGASHYIPKRKEA